MRHKTFELIETKAGEQGTFEALVSVFGNVDYGGDRIKEGAYTKSLDTWRESGDPIPIVFSHQWDDPMSHIGVALPDDVVQTERGLEVKGRLDIEDNPVARQVHKLLKRRSLKEFSIGYQVPDGGESRGKDGVNDISEMELIEAGPTLKGLNNATELAAVKSVAGLKELPEDVQPPDVRDEDEESSPETSTDEIEDGTDEEPEGAKSRPQDPLKQASRAAALEVLSDGASLRTYKEQVTEPPPEPPTEDEQRRRFCDLYI